MQAKVNSGNPQTHAVFFLLRRCDVIFFHYIICGGKSLINNTRVKIRYFSSVFDIANQLLKRHTFLATLSGWWMYGQAFNILKTRSFALRTSRVLASTAWARVEMEFLFVFNSEDKYRSTRGLCKMTVLWFCTTRHKVTNIIARILISLNV